MDTTEESRIQASVGTETGAAPKCDSTDRRPGFSIAEVCLHLAGSFLKHQYLPHILITALFVALSGGFMSFSNIGSSEAARILEMYLSITGILLMTPLFMAEQDQEIWNLEKTKAIPMWVSYLVRLFMALLLILLIITGFTWYLSGQNHLEFLPLWRGALMETCFLGGIGFFAGAVTNQVIIGYMLAFIYFAVNTGGSSYFGHFALFQMMKGHYDAWSYMLGISIVLLAGGIWLRERRR